MTDNKEFLVSQTKMQQKHRTKSFVKKHEKNKTINVRVSEVQHSKIKNLAKAANQSISQYMISQAFEMPKFDRDVAKQIINIDNTINEFYYLDDQIERHIKHYDEISIEDANANYKTRKQLEEHLDKLKDALYKCYLTDIEVKTLEERQKKREEKEHIQRIRLLNVGDALKKGGN